MATADPVSPSSAPVEFRVPVTYTDMFFGEWNQEKTRHFMEHTHIWVSIVVTVAYLLMVRYGPGLMANRKAFDLRTSLALWNFGLSAYSGLSLAILWKHFTKIYYSSGILGTVCNNDDLYTNPESGWWGWLYCMSKASFPLSFPALNSSTLSFSFSESGPSSSCTGEYHHSVTFMLGQAFYTQFVPFVRPGVIINLGVHTIMYFYYGVRAWGVKTERWVSKMITLTQIVQFISSSIFGAHFFHALFTGNLGDCAAKIDAVSVIGGLVVGSYLYLFLQYYRDAYYRNDSPTKKKVEEPVEAKETKKDN
ncbi:hypothetical protein PRIPAC_79356 [Pristionchus pacificus]|uniref:Elongation of very long chain fatty acids protein n=1 Tax=Pristionchus pacificus TaxID=54126 RepID=A0A2A6CP55_PRIPA|nr:hypothetical protein PRIPAC_79356 [Pristionchus pacificus]|eukprot:PDM79857.1 hypothetical protein PRIPAC_32436 [Pristionchus pacificus]